MSSSDDESAALNRMRRQLAESRHRPQKKSDKNDASSSDDDDSSLSSSSSSNSSSSSSSSSSSKEGLDRRSKKKKSKKKGKTDRAKTPSAPQFPAGTVSTAVPATTTNRQNNKSKGLASSSSDSSSSSEPLFSTKMQTKPKHAGAAMPAVREPTVAVALAATSVVEAKAFEPVSMTTQSSAAYNDDEDDEFAFLDLAELEAIDLQAPGEQQQQQRQMVNISTTATTATSINTTEPTRREQPRLLHDGALQLDPSASSSSTTTPTTRSNHIQSPAATEYYSASPKSSSSSLYSNKQPNVFPVITTTQDTTTGRLQPLPPPLLQAEPPPSASPVPPVQQRRQEQYPPSDARGPWETRPAAVNNGVPVPTRQDDHNMTYQSGSLHSNSEVATSSKSVDLYTQDTDTPASLREPATGNQERLFRDQEENAYTGWNAGADYSSQRSGGHDILEPTKIDAEERVAEIHASLCTPPPYRPMPEPMVHYYSPSNRPVSDRRNIPVSQIFDAPVNTLWKSKFDTFNQLQSEIVNTLAYSDDNIVVSAPTGAGKTAVFEMAMARFFSVDLQHNNSNSNASNRGRGRIQVTKQRKIVYVSPSKALCEERFEDWSTRLSAMQLGLEVAVITGDGDPSEAFRDLASNHLILTTPEKWDSLTRRWTENFFLFACVKLFMIDEVHLVADSSRGCCLESVVCRMKGIQRAARKVKATPAEIETSSYTGTSPDAINSTMRIVAVSATLPNISEIAAFLDANEAHTFDESYRPVPLTLHVVGQGFLGDKSSNQFHFWNRLEKDVPNLIHRFSKGRPTIIFCHSKAETERLADILATANGIGSGPVNRDIAGQSRVQKLQRVIMQGIAYHHAGLELDDRRAVERAFIGNKIRALCATSTLAMGVNLPAHLVIIKGTKAWRGGYQDLDQASLLQMIGRAGRPGFDTSGTAVIMTDNASKARFEQLATSGLEPAKSQILSKLVAVVNTEISQLVITSTETALNWIKGTLFFVQLNKDPMAHGLQSASPHAIDSHLLQLCGNTIRRLQSLGAKVSGDGHEIIPVPANHIMSHQLVTCEAMELFAGLPFDASQCQILKALAEIEDIHRPVRRSEKKALNETHKMIKYKLDGAPSKVRVQKPAEKVLVLLQAGIGQIYLEDYAMRKEMSAMVDYSSRMLVAIEEYSVRGSMNGQVAVQSLKLRRSLATSLWTASNGGLNQLMGVGQQTTTSLKFNGITTFQDVLASTAEAIEKAAQRAAPFGAKLRSAVSEILRSTLRVSGEIEFTPGSITPKAIICSLETNKDAPPMDGGSEVRSNVAPAVTYTLIVYTDRPGGCLIYQKNISSPGTYKVASPATFGKITMQLVASMVGLDEKIELEGNAELAPSSFSGTTDKVGAGSQRKMRGSKRTVQHDITSHFKSSMKSTADPRMRQTGPSKKRTVSSKRVSDSASQALWTSSSGARATKPSVTPSPKPFLSEEGRVPAPAAGMASVNRVSSKTSVVAIASNVSSQGVWAHAVDTGRRENEPTEHRATSETFVNKRPIVSQRADQARSLLSPGPSWKQAKREQQRSQQRAFTQKRDNPFSLYKHDPNDAESYLETLSSRNTELSPQNSVIPSAYQIPPVIPQSARGGMHFQQQRPGVGQRGRRQFPGGRLSERDLLAQKAAEQNEYAGTPSWQPSRATMPTFATQDSYSDRSPAFDRPGRVNPPYGSQMAQHNTMMMPMHQDAPRYADEWAGVDDRSCAYPTSAPPGRAYEGGSEVDGRSYAYPVPAPPGRAYEGPSAFYDGESSYQYSGESTQLHGAFQQPYYPRGGASTPTRVNPAGREPRPQQQYQPCANSSDYHDLGEKTMGMGDQGSEDVWCSTARASFNGSNTGGLYGAEQCPPESSKVSHGPASLEDVYGMDQKDLEATFF